MAGLTLNRTVQEPLYAQLRSDILRGVHPPGAQLNESELSRRYSVSRSPLREALSRLAGEGLLEAIPNRGIFVRRFTEKYINDVLNMRDILERRGVRSFRNTEDERNRLAAMRAEAEAILSQQPFDVERHNEFDARMHRMVMGFNDNEYIDQLSYQIYTLSTLFSIQLKTPEGGIESEMQHIELIDTLLRGELVSAERLLQKHIRRTKKLVRDAMKKTGEAKKA
ncbi:MAG: GntR family transcriptional regulator [Candidatus Heteroscillospira sp.]|jgi:DNA-binding GntR family transcriptional regulator